MFLRNCWYAATWSKDLDTTPMARTFLNEKVVLYRNASGEVAALEDRCCHRAAPLSKGEVDGDFLMCGYHGLRFDGTGKCVMIPGQDKIPASARVRAYPVEERWSVVWIWMGDPEKADPAAIPELSWLGDPEWVSLPGYIHLTANYQYLVDNLLDLTHVTYVHKNTLAGDPREATTPTKTERLPDGVRVGRWMIDFVPPPLFQKAGNFPGNVDRWQWVTWKPPATVYLDVGAAETGTGAPEGDRSKGISIWSNHLITPETEDTTHYMFCYARNFQTDNEELSKILYEGSKATFLEDADILQAVQSNQMGRHGTIDGLVDVAADAAQIQARRRLAKMIQEEAEAADAAVAAK